MYVYIHLYNNECTSFDYLLYILSWPWGGNTSNLTYSTPWGQHHHSKWIPTAKRGVST